MTLASSTPASPHRVLVFLLSASWTGIARLPRALTHAGFEVSSYCSPRSLLARTVHAKYCYAKADGDLQLAEFAEVVRRAQPALIIPGCELSVDALQQIVRLDDAGQLQDRYRSLADLARRSTCRPEHFATVLSKHRLHELAGTIGIQVPPQTLAGSESEAAVISRGYGYPVVLKGDAGVAGRSVAICRGEDELVASYRRLAALPNAHLAVQAHVHGTLMMRAAVSLGGRLLDSVAAQKLHTHPEATSPCSVARHLDDRVTATALAALIEALGFTGFCGADFIIDTDTGDAWLLDFNPRPIPLCSFSAIFGHDLPSALRCGIDGTAVNLPQGPPRHDTVALFPNEWLRDLNSPFLHDAHHDVPWDDPSLLQGLMSQFLSPPPAPNMPPTPRPEVQ